MAAEFLRAQEAVLLRAPAAYWTDLGRDEAQESIVVARYADKWVDLSGEEGALESCPLDAVPGAEGVADLVRAHDLGSSRIAEVDGVPALAVTWRLIDGGTTTAWIDADPGHHHLLKMTVAGNDEPVELLFSEFDAPFDDVVAPPADQVVAGVPGPADAPA